MINKKFAYMTEIEKLNNSAIEMKSQEVFCECVVVRAGRGTI